MRKKLRARADSSIGLLSRLGPAGRNTHRAQIAMPDLLDQPGKSVGCGRIVEGLADRRQRLPEFLDLLSVLGPAAYRGLDNVT
jgi:hypothetical protein